MENIKGPVFMELTSREYDLEESMGSFATSAPTLWKLVGMEIEARNSTFLR